MRTELPRPLLLAASFLLVTRVGLGLDEALSAERLPAVSWRSTPEALREAEHSGRPLLLDFGADWCRPCERMSREVFAEPAAGRFVNETFVPARVEDGLAGDGLSDEEAAALRRRYGVEAFPTLLVVQDGEIRARMVGYGGREQTLAFLRASVAAAP